MWFHIGLIGRHDRGGAEADRRPVAPGMRAAQGRGVGQVV